ncbi:BREX-1 system adenine-specific DNA-methyltransferase PglX [Celeribacter halophilus]|uniref:BREX-1 system adenine-specific DNA-methyltransferase PglX n=1 Tax=Celeribacter halophilus TaxID=576117 RepID=UPI003A8D8EFB
MTINTNALKAYAPKARKDFIAAMVSRAAKFGITKQEIIEQREQGEVVIVGSDAFSKKVGEQRERLISRIKQNGFEQAMEAAAYTWFNRIVAIRYMELHGLLDHGYRVLSHPSGKELPEILERAEHVDFLGLDKSKVIDLKLDGTKDAELYRMLLIAQCNALHRALPFLFERIDDETELLLPDNLLHTDSLIRKLVAAIDEANWQDIEVIGWLYQFYISEKKDAVFARPKGKKISAENIPAATQLFTPHWIVRYLVENSLGRLWLLNRPQSCLAERMDYYIAPEEPETDFLRISGPEEIKVCDPACGSGHMLTYAFDLLYAIYEEEGYDPSEIPTLILTHNLTGVEIDDRAGALAAFALAMKAAAKLGRRRFLRMKAKPDICVLQENKFKLGEFNDFVAELGYDLNVDRVADRLTNVPLALAGIWKPVARYLKAAEDPGFEASFETATETFQIDLAEEIGVFEEASQNPFLLEQLKALRGSLLAIASADAAHKERKAFENDFAKATQSPCISHRVAKIGTDYHRHKNDTTYRMELDALIARAAEATMEAQSYAKIATVGRKLVEAIAFHAPLWVTLKQFEQAKNFGSLIVPKLPDPAETLRVVEARDFGGDLLLKEVQERVIAVLRMAEALSPKYHVVVANPPYMGSGGMNSQLKDWAKTFYQNSKSDMYAMFMERALGLCVRSGSMAMINMQSWMFLSSYEKLRLSLAEKTQIVSMAHIGERGFDSIGGAVVSTTAFVLKKSKAAKSKGIFLRLIDGRSEREKSDMAKEAIRKKSKDRYFLSRIDDFEKISGRPWVYWLSDETLASFDLPKILGDVAEPKVGLTTADTERFVRRWFEIGHCRVGFEQESTEEAKVSGFRWFPFHKGGEFRRWYGNNEYVVNYENDGAEIKHWLVNNPNDPSTNSFSRYVRSPHSYFLPSLTWSKVSSSSFAVRFAGHGYIISDASNGAFPPESMLFFFNGLLNSCVAQHFLGALSASLNFFSGDIAKIPIHTPDGSVDDLVLEIVSITKSDWDAYETSWDFTTLPLLSPDHRGETLEDSYETLRAHWQSMTDEMQRLEEENNRIFIDAYGLQDELTPDVPLNEITLTCNPAYRYGVKGTEREREDRLRSDTMKELVSYAIGCMMGRYSLAEPGLIYANAGNEGFDASRYGDFPADDDGIVPITEVEWFDDDAAMRFHEFLKVAWPLGTLRENLRFVAESIAANGANNPQKTIRNYIAKGFFKDHLKTYKKRPIYWLFSSGKLKAFECLVYLHRYNEGTLSRMRMEYVTPLQSRMAARIDSLDDDISGASSSAARTKAQKEKDLLVKQLEELRAFDEELRHYADQRIRLDLDEGVKANYGKFGNLLAERKAITGEKD